MDGYIWYTFISKRPTRLTINHNADQYKTLRLGSNFGIHGHNILLEENGHGAVFKLNKETINDLMTKSRKSEKQNIAVKIDPHNINESWVSRIFS